MVGGSHVDLGEHVLKNVFDQVSGLRKGAHMRNEAAISGRPVSKVSGRLIEDVEAGIAGVQLVIVVDDGLPVGVDGFANKGGIIDDSARELR